MATTELIALLNDKSDDPGMAVCYARGSVFRREGNFLRVEKGKRTRVSRALCIATFYGEKCKTCPNHEATLTLCRVI